MNTSNKLTTKLNNTKPEAKADNQQHFDQHGDDERFFELYLFLFFTPPYFTPPLSFSAPKQFSSSQSSRLHDAVLEENQAKQEQK